MCLTICHNYLQTGDGYRGEIQPQIARLSPLYAAINNGIAWLEH